MIRTATAVALTIVMAYGSAIAAAAPAPQAPGVPGKTVQSPLSAPADVRPAAAGILVLPFENASGDPTLQWLGEASAVLVATGLRSRGVPALSREERVRAFDELHLPMAATLSRATIIKVAELLGARELVAGSFRVKDRELTVQAHVIRVDAGRAQPAVTAQGPLTELFGVHDRLVQALRPDSTAPSDAEQPPPLGAFENYIKGLLAETPSSRADFLETAIREFPAFEAARLSLWEVRTDEGDHEAALAAIRGIQAASPFFGVARFYAATSMLNLERYDDAFETLSGLAAQDGMGTVKGVTRGAINNNLGLIQIRRGATPETGTAVYFLTKATDADPNETDYFFNLGYAYALEKNYQGTVYWLREALRRDPTDADAHFVLAAALQATGKNIEAGRERDLARQLSSRYEELARSAAADRQAVPRGLERIQLDPAGSGSLHAGLIAGISAQRDQKGVAAFHLERGKRLFEKEQDTEALAELRRAVYLSPYEAQAHLLIGRIYLRAARPADAIDALKISIWSADTVAARLALAEAYLKTGDKKGAQTQAEHALAMDPSSADARRIIGESK
jgi:tetratricopeptide (TPR) repeat protein/TolB-like protein